LREYGTPIINQPESPSFHRAWQGPVVLTDANATTLSPFARCSTTALALITAIDGADAGKFMLEFKNALETGQAD